MVDKKNIKKKSVLQKQKQKQSVVVNINTHKPKTQPRPRKRKPTADKENETLLEKQQKQLIYPSVIHAQPENIFDKVMSIQRQTQIDNALEQLTKTERNNLLEKAKKEEVKPKIVEISSRKLPEQSILGSSNLTAPAPVASSLAGLQPVAPVPVAPATTPLITPINTTQSPITTIPEPTPINTTVQRDITVLETPAVPESAIVAYVGNKTPSQNIASKAESRPYLTAINIPSSYSSPFSGSGQKLDTTLTDLSTQYITRQMLAEITQKRIDDAQRQAEIDQLNEPYESAIILPPPKIKLPKPSPPASSVARLQPPKPSPPASSVARLQPPKGKKQEEIAKLLKEYSRDSLLQIAKDYGIPQKNGETKQNLIERMYTLTNINWNKYKKSKRQPRVENNLIK